MSKRRLSQSFLSFIDLGNFNKILEKDSNAKDKELVSGLFKNPSSKPKSSSRKLSVSTPKKPTHSRLLSCIYASNNPPNTFDLHKKATNNLNSDKLTPKDISSSFDNVSTSLNSSLKSRRLLSKRLKSKLHQVQCSNFFESNLKQPSELLIIKNRDYLKNFQDSKQLVMPIFINSGRAGNTPFTNEVLKRIYIADEGSQTSKRLGNKLKRNSMRSKSIYSTQSPTKNLGIGTHQARSRKHFSFDNFEQN